MSGWRSFWMRRATVPLDSESDPTEEAGRASEAGRADGRPRHLPSKRYFRLTVPLDREDEPMDYRIRVPKDQETAPLDRSPNVPLDHASSLGLDDPSNVPMDDPSSLPMDPSGVPMDYPCRIPMDHSPNAPLGRNPGPMDHSGDDPMDHSLSTPLGRNQEPMDHSRDDPMDHSPNAPLGRIPGPMDRGSRNPIGRKGDPMDTVSENSDFRDDALTWKAPDWVATNLHIDSERPADVLALIQHFATDHRYYPPPIDVKQMRRRMGFTQTQFARRFGVPVATLRHWERGDRKPRLAARALLHLIDKFPQLVLRGLRPRPATASSAASGSTPSPRGKARPG
jgi:DNA-binding transcriptional regulator YiaG